MSLIGSNATVVGAESASVVEWEWSGESDVLFESVCACALCECDLCECDLRECVFFGCVRE